MSATFLLILSTCRDDHGCKGKAYSPFAVQGPRQREQGTGATARYHRSGLDCDLHHGSPSMQCSLSLERTGKGRGELRSCCFRGSKWFLYTWASPRVCTSSPGTSPATAREPRVFPPPENLNRYVTTCVLGSVLWAGRTGSGGGWPYAAKRGSGNKGNYVKTENQGRTADMGQHAGEERVRGDVEGHPQTHVTGALVQLACQLAVGHVELQGAITIKRQNRQGTPQSMQEALPTSWSFCG